MKDNTARKEEFSNMSSFLTSPENDGKSILVQLKKHIIDGKHIILSGPPGTGKTRTVDLIKEELKDSIGIIDVVQFHPSFSYQDFIEGYSIINGKYEPTSGIFLQFLEECKKVDKDKLKIFVIDEINRGDIPSIFGELMLLMDGDSDRSVKTSKFSTPISIPDNLVIIGTMNTADRSIKQLDLALRRRFSFIFVKPDYKGLTEWLHVKSFDIEEFDIDEYVKAIKTLNNRIIKHPMLGKNMTLGQSLFVPKTHQAIKLEDLTSVFNDTVLPQLEAYIGFGNKKELDELLGTPEIRNKLDQGGQITDENFVSLINILITAQS